MLLAVDGYRYGGRDFDRARRRRGAAGRDPDASSRPFVLPYLDPAARLDGDALLARAASARAALEFAQLPFDHPLWVLYSSGTTGLPKAIVHGQGGILLEHLKQLHLHIDAQRRRPALLVHDDRLDDVELPASAGC